jgi:hypothetical protein
VAAAAPVAGLVLLEAPLARPELPKVKPPEPDSVLVLEAVAATDAEAKLNENVGQLVDVLPVVVEVPKGDEVVVEGVAAAAGALPKLAPKPDVAGEEEKDDDPNDEVGDVEEREEPNAGGATEDPNDPNVGVAAGAELPKDPNAVVAGGGEGLDPNGAADGEAGGDPNVEVDDGEGEDPNSDVPAGRSSVAVVSADARVRLLRPRGEREPRTGPPGLSSSSTDSRSTADDGAAVTGEVDEGGSGEAPLPPEKEGVGAPPAAASWGTGEAGASAAPPKLTRSLEGVSGPPAPAGDAPLASPGCSAAAVVVVVVEAARTSGW